MCRSFRVPPRQEVPRRVATRAMVPCHTQPWILTLTLGYPAAHPCPLSPCLRRTPTWPTSIQICDTARSGCRKPPDVARMWPQMWPAETGDARTLPTQEPLSNGTAHSNTYVHAGTLNSEPQGRASLGPVLPCRGLRARAGNNGLGGDSIFKTGLLSGAAWSPMQPTQWETHWETWWSPGTRVMGFGRQKTPLLHTPTTDDPWNAGSAVRPCAALVAKCGAPLSPRTPGFKPCPDPLGTSTLTPLTLASVPARGSSAAGARAIRRAHTAGFHALVLIGPYKATRTGPQDKEAAEHTLYERVACPSPRPSPTRSAGRRDKGSAWPSQVLTPAAR